MYTVRKRKNIERNQYAGAEKYTLIPENRRRKRQCHIADIAVNTCKLVDVGGVLVAFAEKRK